LAGEEQSNFPQSEPAEQQPSPDGADASADETTPSPLDALQRKFELHRVTPTAGKTH
jgi:hypothetical protein